MSAPPVAGADVATTEASSPSSRRWLIAHLVILGAGFAFLLWAGHRNWFIFDEWWMIADRGLNVDDVLRPHNEHLSGLAVVHHRLWFALFGVRTYVPYLTGLLLFHVLNVHLLWRLLRRMLVPEAVALAVSTLFLVLGAGYSDLISAFQIVFISPIAVCFGSLLLYSRKEYPRRRLVGVDAVVTGLMVFGIFAQTLTLSVVIIVAGYLVLYRRFRAAVLISVVPVLVYGAWFMAYKDERPPADQPASEGLRNAPQFVWDGITGGLGHVVGVRGVGIALVLILAGYVALRVQWREQRWRLALCPVVGALTFMVAVSVARSNIPGVATSSRYVYVVVALFLPLIGLALGELYEVLPARQVVLSIATVIVLLIEVNILFDESGPLIETADLERGRVVASYELMAEGREPIDTEWHQIELTPLNAEIVRMLGDDGKLPLGTADDNDRLNALGFVSVGFPDEPRFPDSDVRPTVTSLELADTEPTPDACLAVNPTDWHSRVGIRFDAPADLLIRRPFPTDALVSLGPRDRDVVERAVSIPEGESYLSADLEGEYVYLEVASPDRYEICGLAPLDS